jgi:NAD(P)-dependent dehydrogenase (short-subunit alcohol dehydrogenase family)
MTTMSFNDLNGKVCVITGGAGVIGTALVKAMASAGVKIAIADINKETADKVATAIANEFNAQVIGVEANVLDKESLIKAKQIINDQLGDIINKKWLSRFLVFDAGGRIPYRDITAK